MKEPNKRKIHKYKRPMSKHQMDQRLNEWHRRLLNGQAKDGELEEIFLGPSKIKWDR